MVTGNHLLHSGNTHTIHRLYKQKSQLHEAWFLLFLNLWTFDLYSIQADIKPSRECKTTKKYIRFEVLIAVTMKTTTFQDVMTYDAST